MANKKYRKIWENFIDKYNFVFVKNDDINKKNVKNDYIKRKFVKNESNKTIWIETLNKVIKYIIDNNKRPTTKDKNENIRFLGNWISTQLKNYKNKNKIMKNNDIYIKWVEFVTKHKQYFMTDEELWFDTIKNIKNYIIKYEKTPSTSDKNIDIKKMGVWLVHQKQNYSKKKKSMKNIKILSEWKKFIVTYKEYL